MEEGEKKMKMTNQEEEEKEAVEEHIYHTTNLSFLFFLSNAKHLRDIFQYFLFIQPDLPIFHSSLPPSLPSFLCLFLPPSFIHSPTYSLDCCIHHPPTSHPLPHSLTLSLTSHSPFVAVKGVGRAAQNVDAVFDADYQGKEGAGRREKMINR